MLRPRILGCRPSHAMARLVLALLAAHAASAAAQGVLGDDPAFTSEADAELLGVAVLTRTGDRHLVHRVGQNDDVNASLTSTGYKRMRYLGELLGSRYRNRLHLADAAPEDLARSVYVTASERGYTRESGEAVMEGMFGRRMLPMHTLAESADITLRGWGKCNRLHDLLKEVRGGYAYQKLEQESLDLRKAAAAFVGLESCEMDQLWNLYDRLVQLPADDTVAYLGPVTALLTDIHRLESVAAAEVRLAGYLLREINDFVRDVAGECGSGQITYKQYFGHFTTLTAFRTLINLNVTDAPDFGASYVAELYKQVSTNVTFIKWNTLNIVGRNVQTFTPRLETAHVKGCKAAMYVATTRRFLEMTTDKEASPAEWCEYCNNHDVAVCAARTVAADAPPLMERGMYIMLATGIIALAAVVFILWRCYALRRCREVTATDLQSPPKSALARQVARPKKSVTFVDIIQIGQQTPTSDVEMPGLVEKVPEP